MGWRDYNQGNLSAFDGDLGLVEVKLFKSKMRRKRKKTKSKRDKRDLEK